MSYNISIWYSKSLDTNSPSTITCKSVDNKPKQNCKDPCPHHPLSPAPSSVSHTLFQSLPLNGQTWIYKKWSISIFRPHTLFQLSFGAAISKNPWRSLINVAELSSGNCWAAYISAKDGGGWWCQAVFVGIDWEEQLYVTDIMWFGISWVGS